MLDSAAPGRPRPLSLNQDQQLVREWIAHTRADRRPPFMGWMGLEFDARPDIPRLERALNMIIERHEILRTTFTEPSSIPASRRSEVVGRLKALPITESLFDQRVHAEARVSVTEGVLEGLQRNWVVRELAHDVLRAQFENGCRYDTPPLVRATVFRCEDDRHLLSIAIPHLVTDGSSMQVFRKELAALYHRSVGGAAAVPMPPLPAQYADFAVWQRQQLATACDDAMSYWQKRWAEFLPAIVKVREIPYAKQVETAPVAESGRVASPLDPAQTGELRAFCKRHGVTTYIACLAATAITLRLYTGRDDVALMVPGANRTQPQWRSLIGWFSNVFMCGLSVPAASGEAVLREARRATVGLVENQIVPLSVTWRALIRAGIIPRDFYIPDAISLDYATGPREPAQGEPWQRPVWSYIAATQREPSMAIRVVDGGRQVTLVCTYPVANLSPADAHQILNDVQSVLRMLMRSPHEPLRVYHHILGTPPVPAT